MRKLSIRSLYAIVLLCLVSASPQLWLPNRTPKLLEREGYQRTQFSASASRNGLMYYTNLDSMRNLMLYVRKAALLWIMTRMGWLKASNAWQGKIQRSVPRHAPFPCNLNHTRSAQPPTDISQLRPGDIDVIAAFGDSISAGNGILSTTPLSTIYEFRGLTFSGGGIETWRTSLTLPNILKLYNPKLYGYTVSHSLVAEEQLARLNIAEPMLIVRDLPFQAQVLIDRMQRDVNVDMARHWKLLTIYVGLNDVLMHQCLWDDMELFLREQAKHLHRTFALLRDNVPRLLINLILMPDITELEQRMRGSPQMCQRMYHTSCIGLNYRPQYLEGIKRWHHMQIEMANAPEFRGDDFAIMPHNIFQNFNSLFRRESDGKTDLRYFSNDCAHFSQLGHAVLANLLWNSMLGAPDLSRTKDLKKPLKHFSCPSEQQPFLRIRNDELQAEVPKPVKHAPIA